MATEKPLLEFRLMLCWRGSWHALSASLGTFEFEFAIICSKQVRED